MLLLVLTYTIAASSQQAVYNYYPRIVKIVDSFEDIKIKIVDSFEGIKN